MIEQETSRASSPAQASDDARGGHAGLLVLAAIMVLALVLRMLGIGYLLPHQTDPDGNVFVTQVELLESGAQHPERELLFGFYPTLIPRLASIVPIVQRGLSGGSSASSGAEEIARPAPTSLAGQLEAASAEYLRIRIVVALLSLLIVPGTWLLARRFMGPGAALCAALLMATSVLDLWFAQQARPHAASAAFALLGVLAALNLRRRGRPIDYVATGLALGLAVASLQSGLAVVLPIAMALILRTESARKSSVIWFVATIAFALVFVLLFYPFLFAPAPSKGGVKLELDGQHLNLWGHIVPFGLFNGDGFGRVGRTLYGYEPWIFGLAILGGVLAIARVISRREARDAERIKDLAVVLAYAVPYLIAFGLYARTYQRFVIPLLPYLACLAAYAIMRIASRLGARRPAPGVQATALRAQGTAIVAQGPAPGVQRTAMFAIVALALLAPQVVAAFTLVSIRRAKDTATLAAEWVSQHLKPGEDKILMQYPLELPLPSTPASLSSDDLMMSDMKHPWVIYQRALPESKRLQPAWNMPMIPMRRSAEQEAITSDAAGYIKGLHGDYAVIDVYDGGRKPVVLNAIPPAMHEIGERIARFSPDATDEGCNLPIMYQDDEYPGTTPWLWRVLHAERTGPVIEIYKLR